MCQARKILFMKKPKPLFPLLLFSLFLIFAGCKANKDDLFSSTEEVLVKNIWTVEYYFNNQDMTGEFSSSRLLFSTTGAVGYQKNGETTSGKWSRTFDVANNELIDLQFNTSNVDINRLNESWMLIDRSSSALQLEGNSGAHIILRIKAQ